MSCFKHVLGCCGPCLWQFWARWQMLWHVVVHHEQFEERLCDCSDGHQYGLAEHWHGHEDWKTGGTHHAFEQGRLSKYLTLWLVCAFLSLLLSVSLSTCHSVHTHTLTHTHSHTHTHTPKCIHTYRCYLSVSMYVCMYVSMYSCMYVLMYVCIDVWLHLCIVCMSGLTIHT